MTIPRVGISACLLGQRTRHDGGHKRNEWLVDHLGEFVTFVPICPEVEMGLGIPRESMHLTGRRDSPRLVTVRTARDLTAPARTTAERLLAKDLDIDCFVFKKDSPSCGLERVRIYGNSGIPSRTGTGLFSEAVKSRYPLIPKIEEGRLSDCLQREAFTTQLFAYARLRRTEHRIAELQVFHQSYKLLLMAQDPALSSRLGEIAANSGRQSATTCFREYTELLMKTLQMPATISKRVNALQHIFGYFKQLIDSTEKQLILEVIEEYRKGETTLVAPLTLLKHLAHRHSVEYLKGQMIFEPFPKKLMICGPSPEQSRETASRRIFSLRPDP